MRAWRVGPIPSEVSILDVKANSRTLHDDEDLLIQHFIDAAHERAEQETGRVFGEGEWIIEADSTCDRLAAPLWPILAVPAGWSIETNGRGAVLVAGDWPTDRRITVTAGEPMPHTVRQAVLLMASYWIDQRNTASAENMQEVPYGASMLLGLNRRMFC